MLSSSIDGHACIINCDRLLSCGLFVMPCHGKFHCTSFNDGNPMINGKNALVTVTVDLGCLALTYISGNSLGKLTPRSTFSVWKFPWKYDLLWRQKLQETGISNRFPAVSTVSGGFHPISRAKKSPRPLIFSHLPLFAISFLGKSLNTNIAATECYLGRVWANFT